MRESRSYQRVGLQTDSFALEQGWLIDRHSQGEVLIKWLCLWRVRTDLWNSSASHLLPSSSLVTSGHFEARGIAAQRTRRHPCIDMSLCDEVWKDIT